MKPIQFASVLILCGLLSRAANAQDWSQFQHNPAHTGRTVASIDPSKLTLQWSAADYFVPRIDNKRIIATGVDLDTSSQFIAAFSLNGTQEWTYAPVNSFIATAAPSGPLVVVVYYDLSRGYNFLSVLDSATGVPRYTLPLPSLGNPAVLTTIARDPAVGKKVAYCTDGGVLAAIALNSDGASVLWMQSGDFGGNRFPTVVGQSIILAGPCQYYAFDRETGAPNHFFQGNCTGGGGITAAYDFARKQFYIRTDYNPTPQLSAFHYENNENISLVWQIAEPSTYGGGTVAIGPDGGVYDVNTDQIAEINPADGSVLRTIAGSFVNGCTPSITQNVLWAYSENETFAYDLGTLRTLATLNGADAYNFMDGPGAFTTGVFVLERLNGFDVYQESQ